MASVCVFVCVHFMRIKQRQRKIQQVEYNMFLLAYVLDTQNQ